MKESLYRLKSKILRNERTIWIREPADLRPPFNLAIFLDAEFYRDRVGAESVIANLEGAVGIPPTLFVFVSQESLDARWQECPCNPSFATFVAHELLPWIETIHPAAMRSPERVLVGLSYTGLAAAYVAISSPGKFTKVIAQSGSFWWNDCWLAQWVRTTERQPLIAFYLDVGSRETDENIQHRPDVLQGVSQIYGVKCFRDALAEQGHRVKYVEFDGGHDFAAWGATLPHALRWALASVSANRD